MTLNLYADPALAAAYTAFGSGIVPDANNEAVRITT